MCAIPQNPCTQPRPVLARVHAPCLTLWLCSRKCTRPVVCSSCARPVLACARALCSRVHVYATGGVACTGFFGSCAQQSAHPCTGCPVSCVHTCTGGVSGYVHVHGFCENFSYPAPCSQVPSHARPRLAPHMCALPGQLVLLIVLCGDADFPYVVCVVCDSLEVPTAR